MSAHGVRQAAQVLRIHLSTLASHDSSAELSAMANLIYADRLNQPPIHPTDPDALEQVSQRYSEILSEHLHLELILLSVAAGGLGQAPDQLLDDIVTTHLGGYT